LGAVQHHHGDLQENLAENEGGIWVEGQRKDFHLGSG